MGNGKTNWLALAGAGMAAAPLPASTDGGGLMNFTPKEQPEEAQASPDQVAAEQTSDLIDALGMPQPERQEPSPARTIMQIHKDGVEEMKAKDNPLAGVMETVTPVVRRFATIPFNSFGRNIGHALHANQVEKTRARIQERKKQEELGAPIEDDLQMQQEPVENVFDKAFGAVGDFVGDLFGVQAAAAQSIDSSQYNDRDTTETRESLGIAGIDDKRFVAPLRGFNWTGINKVALPRNLANFEAAFAGKHIGDMMLIQGDGKTRPAPAFQTPEDGIRYFGWWLESKGNPATLRELADGWWKNDTANKDPWLASVSSISGLDPDDLLTEPVLGDLFIGISGHEGGHAFTDTFGTTHDIDIGRYIREGQQMHRDAALQLGQTPSATDIGAAAAEGDLATVSEAAATIQNPVHFLLTETQMIGHDGKVLADQPYTSLNEADKASVDILTLIMNQAAGGTPYGEGPGKTSVTTWQGAWCAAFMDHVLRRLSAPQLDYTIENPDTQATDQYNRVRAAAMLNYGDKVDGLDNSEIGDIVVLKPGRANHVSFYVDTVDRYVHDIASNARSVQQALTDLDATRDDSILNPNGVDGIYGSGTTAAVRAYQKNVLNLADEQVTGQLTAEQYETLVGSAPATKRQVAVLGGNQNNQVKISFYDVDKIRGIRRIRGVESLSEEDFKALSQDIARGGSDSTR